MILVIAIILSATLIILSLIKPSLAFWIVLLVFFDPGGYIQIYLTRSMIGGLQISDITFLLLFIPLLSPKVNVKAFFKKKDNLQIISFLVLYTVFYHTLIYGFYAGGGHFSDLVDFLQYQRLTIFGFLSIIPSYIFLKKDCTSFLKIALLTSLIIVILFILRMASGIDLLPVQEFERTRGTGILRISMLSYGFAQWFLYISMILIVFNIKFSNKWQIFFIGLVIFIAEILTLTRRNIIAIAFQFFLIYFFRQKMVGISLISTQIRKILFSIAVLILILYLLYPQYLNYTITVLKDAYSIVTTGFDTRGNEDVRVSYDIPRHLEKFKANPIIGGGWDELWYSNDTLEGGMSANDLPLTAAIGMFGLLGVLLYLPFYLILFRILVSSFEVIKNSYLKGIRNYEKVYFLIGILMIVFFTTKFTINIFTAFSDLIIGKQRVLLMLNLGFLLASRDKLSELAFQKKSFSKKY